MMDNKTALRKWQMAAYHVRRSGRVYDVGFETFCELWAERWDQRGNYAGGYVMGLIDLDGGFTEQNVVIEEFSSYVARMRRFRKNSPEHSANVGKAMMIDISAETRAGIFAMRAEGAVLREISGKYGLSESLIHRILKYKR